MRALTAHEHLLLDLDHERDWADHDQQVADRLQDYAPANASVDQTGEPHSRSPEDRTNGAASPRVGLAATYSKEDA